MSPIKILINGGFGRMGQMAFEGLAKCDDISVVAQLGKADDLISNLHAQKPDIVLELTQANVVFENSKTIIEQGFRPLIGASGLDANDHDTLKKMADAKSLSGMIVPNFSIGAVLMMRMSAYAARYLPDVEIIERHHPQKIDIPSATALHTQQMIEAERGNDGKSTIPIHSQRMQGSLAHQSVRLGGAFESLLVHHDSLDRRCFLPGIILCIRSIMEKEGFYIGLETLLSTLGMPEKV